MNTETLSPLTHEEQRLIGMIRGLPTESIFQLIDFAKFLEFKWLSQRNLKEMDKHLDSAGTSDYHWDNLLAPPSAKRRLRELAQEALTEELEGHTTEIMITSDGRLTPA